MASLLRARLRRAEAVLTPKKGKVLVVMDRGNGGLEDELAQMRADGRLRPQDELVTIRMRFIDQEGAGRQIKF